MTNDNKIKKSPIKITKIIADLSQVEWLPLSEVSILVEKSSSSIREAINERNGKHSDGCYQWRKNGRNYEILLSSIPNNAQNNYINQQLTALKPRLSTELTVKVAPEGYSFERYQCMANDYAITCDSIKAEAERRLKVLDEYHSLIKIKVSKGKAESLIKQRHNDSKATLWRFNKAIKGHDRAYWIYLLAPNYEERQKKYIPQEAWTKYKSLYGVQTGIAASVVYYQVKQLAKNLNWGELPSLKTFMRAWDALPEDYRIFTRKGATALKERSPSINRDYTSILIHEYWEADGRKADVFCKWADGSISRPWIVVMRDVRTRMVLSVRLLMKAKTCSTSSRVPPYTTA
jgi:putative transposase